jgi:monofunctional glycosyltransferase
MMEWASVEPATALPPYRPTALQDIAPALRRAVIIGEDSRFWTHPGIDVVEIRDALGIRPGAGFGETVRDLWRGRDRFRGASTITQQLAKNLYLSPSRNPLRKVKEAVTAFRLEVALSKERILELYLNVAEWGPGIWGVDAASRRYFGVDPAGLSEWQAAALAATLPFPRSSNPAHQPDRMYARQHLILARMGGADVVIPSVPEEIELPPIDSLVLADSLLPRDTLRVPVDTLLPPPVPIDTASRDTVKRDSTTKRP